MYGAVIEHLFRSKYRPGDRYVEFEREEIETAARALNLDVAKNLGDLVYSFKFRKSLPDAIRATAPKGEEWRVVNAGRSRYRFVLGSEFLVIPDRMLFEIKIPDATPGIIA
ncbi:MAG: endonuclease, partial [Candidatus Baltobacteraceae bacterium]